MFNWFRRRPKIEAALADSTASVVVLNDIRTVFLSVNGPIMPGSYSDFEDHLRRLGYHLVAIGVEDDLYPNVEESIEQHGA